MMTKTDKIVIVFVIVLAILVYLIFNVLIFADNPTEVEIFVDGEEYASYKLAEISGKKTVTVKSEFGINVVEISNRGARVVEASCPDKLDVRMGEITKCGQMIVCVPNRLNVKLCGDNTDVDRVAY